MEAEQARCTVCGAAVEPGSVYVDGGYAARRLSAASLRWRADRRIPRERALSVFGRKFFAAKRLITTLLKEYDRSVPGWYCPVCKKVSAVFDAPDFAFNIHPDTEVAPSLGKQLRDAFYEPMVEPGKKQE